MHKRIVLRTEQELREANDKEGCMACPYFGKEGCATDRQCGAGAFRSVSSAEEILSGVTPEMFILKNQEGHIVGHRMPDNPDLDPWMIRSNWTMETVYTKEQVTRIIEELLKKE